MFRQIRGGRFTYQVIDADVVPDQTNHRIAKSHFEQAFALVPLSNTTPVQHLRGPSYIFAMLMDVRVRGGDW